MKSIKQGGLRRRLSLGVAGAKGGIGLLSSRARGILMSEDDRLTHNEAAMEREALRFVAHLGELKGAYVKIGQMLALYGEHLFPKAVTKALHTLETQTTPLSWESVRQDLPPVFDTLEIEKEAFAAASLAQVHRARLENREVCIKIQYPGIRSAIEGDFENVVQMLKLARWIESGRHLEQVIQELRGHLLSEVDYVQELDKGQRLANLLRDDSRYLVPSYYAEVSSPTVLVMDYVSGYDPMHERVQALSQQRRDQLAKAMLELFFKETFEWGFMQTDPNFGNFKIIIDEHGENDKLALLDFGSVHVLQPQFKRGVKQAIMAAWRGDHDKTIQGLIDLNCLSDTDTPRVKESFAEFCHFLMEPFYEDHTAIPRFALNQQGQYDWAESKLLKRAGKLASKNMLVKGFSLPPSEFMLLARKLTGVFTFVSAMKARFSGAPLLQRYQ